MFGVHKCFERSAEQVRIDGGFRPGACVFARCEAETCERIEEERCEQFVADGWASRALFCGRAGEKATIEKRDLAEGSGGWGALPFRRVERSEGQRSEQSLPEVAAGVEDRFRVSGEECAIIVEPALRFKKLEEEQACDMNECKRATVVVVDAIGPVGGDGADMRFESTEEATSDGMSAEQVVPAQAGQ